MIIDLFFTKNDCFKQCLRIGLLLNLISQKCIRYSIINISSFNCIFLFKNVIAVPRFDIPRLQKQTLYSLLRDLQ